MWSMIADKYSRAFYASGLFEFSDQLKKKQVSQYITYLYTNLHVCWDGPHLPICKMVCNV